MLIETGKNEHLSQEPLIHHVVGFLQVYLEDEGTISPLPLGERVNRFLGSRDVISRRPTRDKTRLTNASKLNHHGFQPIRQELGNDIKQHVAERDRSELIKGGGGWTLGNETDKRRVQTAGDLSGRENLVQQVQKRLLHMAPKLLKKRHSIPIRTRGFVCCHMK